MNERRMQFAIGLVTLIAGFALAAIILWFGEFETLLQPRTIYYVLFKTAPGVEPKVPVRRAGIRIGEVRRVEYSDENSLVAVTIALEGKNTLREGDEPTLRRELLGDSFLDIETRYDMRGKPDRQELPPHTTLEGRSPIDTSRAIASITEVIPTATQAMTEMDRFAREWTVVGTRVNRLLATNEKRIDQVIVQTEDAMNRLSTTLEALNNVLDAKTQENVKVAIANARDASSRLERLLQTGQEAITQFNELSTTLNAASKDVKPLLASSQQAIDKIDRTATRLEEASVDVPALVKSAKTTMDQVGVTAARLDEASVEIPPLVRSGRQTVDRLNLTIEKIDEVASNLRIATKPVAERSESTMRNLDEGIASLNATLNDVEFLLKQFRAKDGTVQRLLSDATLYQRVDDASIYLIRNLAGLEKILADLKVFSDKIARHPGELGVQGVFSRDTGLKSVPPSAMGIKPFSRE